MTRTSDPGSCAVRALRYAAGSYRSARYLRRAAGMSRRDVRQEITAELDGLAVVSSGQTLRHSLLLGNRTGRELQIATNGQVTATVVDPETGEVVGGFSGAQGLPLIIFRIAPAQTGRVPLLIGTASFTPRLGYTVPAGSWGIQATLTVGPDPRGSPRRRTPVLPLTITA